MSPMANPYRQPRDPEKPPKDSMRLVLVAAGALAGVIAIVAIVVGASDRLATRRPPPVVVEKPIIVVSDERPIREAGPAPVIGVRSPLPDGPMSFTASAGTCLGDCIAHTTLIDANGKITLSMRVSPREGLCMPAHPKSVSAKDLAALAARARSLHVETLQSNYVHGRDMQQYSTRVEAGGVSYEITHLHGTGEEAGVDALHREIERLAGTDAWLKTCKRVPRDRIDPHYPSFR